MLKAMSLSTLIRCLIYVMSEHTCVQFTPHPSYTRKINNDIGALEKCSALLHIAKDLKILAKDPIYSRRCHASIATKCASGRKNLALIHPSVQVLGTNST
jgi:hypothetical protein